MGKVIPFLWFDNRAEEAAELYTSIFENSNIQEISGMSVTFELKGQSFIAFNGGPYFNFTPAISFFVNCDTLEEINLSFEKLSKGGKVLMDLNEYPFSEKFGWVEDKFGVSWQLNLSSALQSITPALMFVGPQHGKAEEAMNFYTSIFNNSSIGHIERYTKGEGEAEGTVKHASFSLDGQEFMAMDSSGEHHFTFSEAISLFVDCQSQEEVDKYWEKLSQGGKKSQCGWIKDKYGVSWQIVPTVLGELMNDPDLEKSQRVMNAMLKMNKIDIEELRKAYESR